MPEADKIGRILDLLWERLYRTIPTVVLMKTSLATTISVIGVLAAGGVALAVNSSVLDSATMTAENAPALQAEVLPLANTDFTVNPGSGGTISAQGDGLDATSPTTSVVGAQPTETTIPLSTETTVPASSKSAYNIEGFGVVTLAQSSGSLTVVSVAPVATVKYTTKQESPTRIEVVFVSSAGVTIKFHADVIDGRIVTSVMNEPAPRVGSPSKRGDDHDEDHDDEHEEDHDEDHESGEHDDD